MSDSPDKGSDSETEPTRSDTDDESSDAVEPNGADGDAHSEDDPQDDVDEDAIDLEDLDALGVDGLVAKLDSDPEAGEELLPEGPKRTRSPVLSLGVIGFAIYLLISMFPDFQYWLKSGDPVDLGHASDFVGADGRVPDGYHDQYVVLLGTPDVQHAARLKTKENYVGYLRITEGGGQLFAAVPRSKDEVQVNEFEGQYRGRMRRLGGDRAFPWIEQFFSQQQVIRTHDATVETLVAALENRTGQGLEVQAVQGAMTLDGAERVRLVLLRPQARVQLGVASWRSAAAANAAVEGLGYPYASQGETTKRDQFHRFIVAIPPAEREAAVAKLNGLLEQAPNTADPKEGAAVLDLTATFAVPAADLVLDVDELAFPIGDNTASLGYTLEAGELVERELSDGQVRAPLAEVRAVKLEKPIVPDPDGYLIVVGADPSTERMFGILWLVALGIGLANVFYLVRAWRKS